jgi:hypothetical protein
LLHATHPISAQVELIKQAIPLPTVDSWPAVVFAFVTLFIYLSKYRGESKIRLDELDHKQGLDEKRQLVDIQAQTAEQLRQQNLALQARLDSLTNESVVELKQRNAELVVQKDLLNQELVNMLQKNIKLESSLLLKDDRIAQLQRSLARVRTSRDAFKRISQDAAQELFAKGLQTTSYVMLEEISVADEASSGHAVQQTILDLPPVIDYRTGERDEEE